MTAYGKIKILYHDTLYKCVCARACLLQKKDKAIYLILTNLYCKILFTYYSFTDVFFLEH